MLTNYAKNGARKAESLANSRRGLRIAQIAPPGIPCPPAGYGGSEWVVSNLTEELVRQGHEVVLFANPGSTTRAELAWFPEVYEVEDWQQRELIHVARAMRRAAEFDIIHNHCLSAGPALAGLLETPGLTTLHYTHRIIHRFPEHPYVAVSLRQRSLLPDLNVVEVIYNSVDSTGFPLVETKEDYLFFLGRIDAKKGPDLAIEVAQRLGMHLLIAAPPPSEDNRAYFEECVRPHLRGDIEYLGEVSGAKKIALLANARCILCPVRWEEPFGLVAAEAMACGTPVVAMARGALPEVVLDGVTGYVVNSVDEMVAAVQRVNEIQPARCRQWVQDRFTPAQMARRYLDVYRRLHEGSRATFRQGVARRGQQTNMREAM